MTGLKNLIKQEAVLTIAWILAIISMFIVKPDKNYIDYIDFRTLGILFCLMMVMTGLKKCGFFERIAGRLLKLSGGQRSLELILVLLCFFFGMFITNDVALITFVPLALEVLKVSDRNERVIPVVVMQTVAANLGSMATPIGNPQNLYLYTKSGMLFADFLKLILPYVVVAFVLIIGTVIILTRKCSGIKSETINVKENKTENKNYLKEIIYIVMFILSIMVVVRIIPVAVMLLLILAVVLVMDRKVILEVDYSLLLTFTGFFIFVGNMGRIPQFQNFLSEILTGNEFATSVVLSQIISNVPAAILLSGFTSHWKELLLGVNIGGLGTLIASMASLISYKFVAREYPEKKGQYFIRFTIINVIFLGTMVLFYAVFHGQP